VNIYLKLRFQLTKAFNDKLIRKFESHHFPRFSVFIHFEWKSFDALNLLLVFLNFGCLLSEILGCSLSALNQIPVLGCVDMLKSIFFKNNRFFKNLQKNCKVSTCHQCKLCLSLKIFVSNVLFFLNNCLYELFEMMSLM